ncbi:MAG: hypothetical protein LBE17_01030 [Treponema sp.]|jgi:hypothetical protein|nr:hypothetical protein [Treponema sp.]
MVTHTALFALRVCILLAGLAFAGSCSPRTPTDPAPEPAEISAAEEPVFIPGTLLALVRSGETPLWFELGMDGPVVIPGPAAASEEPFAPWPQARHVAGLAVDGEGRLIMAVNRDGFLAWETREDQLGLYRVSRREDWDPYTAASLFMYRGMPAVLLYQDTFFPQEGAETPAGPAVRVWGLGAGLLEMEETEIPAFAALPQSEGWDVDTLAWGNDGFWYYRGVRQRVPGPEVWYFRTEDLSVLGAPSSVGVFRGAMSPYTEPDMPQPIRTVLEEAEHSGGKGKPLVAEVVSPEFPAQRYFALQKDAAGEQEFVELAGFYRPPDTAAVLFPGGQVFFTGPGAAPLETAAPKAVTLPVLPEGFVYTRIGFAGSTLIVSWEEQQDWQIGAAGFMALNGL